jgi:hypothetical protein
MTTIFTGYLAYGSLEDINRDFRLEFLFSTEGSHKSFFCRNRAEGVAQKISQFRDKGEASI